MILERILMYELLVSAYLILGVWFFLAVIRSDWIFIILISGCITFLTYWIFIRKIKPKIKEHEKR